MLHCPMCKTNGKIIPLECEISGDLFDGSTSPDSDSNKRDKHGNYLRMGFYDQFFVHFNLTCQDCGLKITHTEEMKVFQEYIEATFAKETISKRKAML